MKKEVRLNNTIKNIKFNSAQKRAAIKALYIQDNKTAKGIKSDKEYRKTFSTQKALESKVRNKNEKGLLKNIYRDEKPSEKLKTKLVTQDGLFFDVLGKDSEEGDLFFDAKNKSTKKAQKTGKKHKAVIVGFDGKIEVIESDSKIDIKISELFRECAKLQEGQRYYEKNKKGKRVKRTANYPYISISRGETDKNIYTVVVCNFEELNPVPERKKKNP
jgi:hypothetical protein